MAGRRHWEGSPEELFCSSQAQVSRIIIRFVVLRKKGGYSLLRISGEEWTPSFAV